MTKDLVRKYTEELRNKSIPSSFTTTGGSTGKPLKVYKDKRFKAEILGWRAFSMWNISPADNTAITHRRVPQSGFARFKNRLLWWPTKRIYLSATSMSEEEISRFVQDLTRYKIVWITGYAGALECVADYILAHHIQITTLQLVWSTSAPLTTNSRNKMERAFGCKVMDQYGSCEVSHIAQQCPHSEHLHINYDFVHVDIVDGNGLPVYDEEGDILVTDLYNYAFPLIRYKLGDRGCFVKEACECGVSLPLMKSVKGRTSDMVYTPGGRVIDGSYLTTIFDNYPEEIDQFQIYQKADYSIVVYYRPKDSATERIDKVIETIRATLESDVASEIPISFQQVETIAHDAGKTRYIISEVALNKLNKK
ncbi:MAG: phenylacetate--CoA ligase family protein [Alloprevotella sp.]|nr:phenylacetate--CoA ligase family protein [Alloprevotella sp.]